MPRKPLFCLMTLGGLLAILLVGADLLMGGRRSTVSRYLIPTYLSLQLLAAYFFSTHLMLPKPNIRRLWQSILALVLAMGIVSNAVHVRADIWSNKRPSHLNQRVARVIGLQSESLVIIGNSGAGELMSLSHYLEPTQKLLVIKGAEDLDLINFPKMIFALNLHPDRQKIIENQGYKILEKYELHPNFASFELK